MSLNVLVIPEDHTKDQLILKPLVEALLVRSGLNRARVQVCNKPRLQGVRQALDESIILSILRQYGGMVQLFLLCVDRDGDAGRLNRLGQLETLAAENQATLIAVNAWQELEVWVLGGMKNLPSDWVWDEIRQDRDPKERYFTPYARLRNLDLEPGGGRKSLALEASRNLARVLQLCPELSDLGSRLSTR